MFAKTFFLLNCSFFRVHSLSLQRRTEETKDKEAEKEKEKEKEKIIKLLSEITVGVRNVLSRGSCGKGAATGVPVRASHAITLVSLFKRILLQFEKFIGGFCQERTLRNLSIKAF